MPFTDDDLKRLKEQLPFGQWNQHLNTEALEALLARLETSERGYCHHTNPLNCDCLYCVTWRKAAGKP